LLHREGHLFLRITVYLQLETVDQVNAGELVALLWTM